jgi:hypothetical protein
VLDSLTADDFRPRVGDTYKLGAGEDRAVEVVLAQVDEFAMGPGGTRVPFSIVFHGPPEPVLLQGIRRVETPDGDSLEVFLVPIGPDSASGAMRYEAAFG